MTPFATLFANKWAKPSKAASFFKTFALTLCVGAATASSAAAQSQSFYASPIETIAAPTTALTAQTTLTSFLTQANYQPLKLVQLPTGHQIVQTTINGHHGTFIVDSGAGMTVINNADVMKFGITHDDLIASNTGAGAGGNIGIYTYKVKNIAFDGHDFSFPQISATDLSHIFAAINSTSNFQIQGVIGQDILSKYDAIIDVNSHQLFLRAHA